MLLHPLRRVSLDHLFTICYNTCMLYFAYGMNTNTQEMAARCPAALSLGGGRLVDHTFRFSEHADVIKTPGSYVDGLVWEISNKCLESLDVLEGFPYYYNRREKTVYHNGRFVQAITYFMQPGHVDHAPSIGYFNMVLDGYAQHNIPANQLHNAVISVDV